MDDESAGRKQYAPRAESPLERVRKMHWTEQIDYVNKKLKEGGPLNLMWHRYSIFHLF